MIAKKLKCYVVGGSFVLLLAGLACLAFFGIRSPSDIRAYYWMPRECHIVWQDLALRKIRIGQSLEECIKNTHPIVVKKWGDFTRLEYQKGLSFSGVYILAEKNSLVYASAWGCTWAHTFFTSKSDAEVREIWRARKAHKKNGTMSVVTNSMETIRAINNPPKTPSKNQSP